MSAPTSLDLMRRPGATVALVRRAIRLWPNNETMQREWLRAVGVVRSTSRGWLLDRRVTQEANRA
jgi:Arc/MetJ-type ribon-helix-helix transcriptional regulator